jgi:hypothetical protein
MHWYSPLVLVLVLKTDRRNDNNNDNNDKQCRSIRFYYKYIYMVVAYGHKRNALAIDL